MDFRRLQTLVEVPEAAQSDNERREKDQERADS